MIFVASLSISVPFHWVSIPMFCAAIIIFFNLPLISVPFIWILRVPRLFHTSLTWVFSLLVLIFRSGSFDRICTSSSPAFHFHLFSACGFLSCFAQKPCLLSGNIRGRVFFFSPVPTGNTFSPRSPHIWRLPVHPLLFLRSSSHPALVNCSPYQSLESPRFCCLVLQRSVPRVSMPLKIRDQEVNIVDFVGHTVSSALFVQKQL